MFFDTEYFKTQIYQDHMTFLIVDVYNSSMFGGGGWVDAVFLKETQNFELQQWSKRQIIAILTCFSEKLDSLLGQGMKASLFGFIHQ